MNIQSFFHFLDTYGYLAVIIGSAIDHTGLTPTPLVIAAVYASLGLGHINIFWIIISAIFGTLLADNLLYWIGYSGGRKVIKKYGRFVGLTEKVLYSADQYFKQHGVGTVLWGRFLVVIGKWIPFIAGINQMDYYRFLLYTTVGGVATCLVYGLLSYSFASPAISLLRTLNNIELILIVVVTICIIVAWIYYSHRKRNNSRDAKSCVSTPDQKTIKK